jgi:hypothetical protein
MLFTAALAHSKQDWQWARARRKYFKGQGPAVVRSFLGGVFGGSAIAWYRHDPDWIIPSLIGGVVLAGVAVVLNYGETFFDWLHAPLLRAEERVKELQQRVTTLETKLDVSQRSHAGVTRQLTECQNLLDRSHHIPALAAALMVHYQAGSDLQQQAPQLQKDIEEWRRLEIAWTDAIEVTLMNRGGNRIDVQYFREIDTWTQFQVRAHPDAIYDLHKHGERMTRLNRLVDKYGPA